jgi:hypothetical protein
MSVGCVDGEGLLVFFYFFVCIDLNSKIKESNQEIKKAI